MRKKLVKVVVLILFAGFAACNGDDDYTAYADGDAFIVSRIQGEGAEADTVFGLALHAMGNKDFSGIIVTTPDNGTVQLQPISTYEFYDETDEADFSLALPAGGNYSFACTFTTGETYTSVDVLSDDVLDPVNLTKCEYNATDAQIDLEWEELADVDYFVIFLADEDDKVVYISQSFDGDKTEFNISENTYSWVNGEIPTTGKTYTVVINAYMYEASPTKQLDIQAKSIATGTVVWGGEN